MTNEKKLHKQICEYIKIQYPKVIFSSDMAGQYSSIGVATYLKSLRSGRGLPDLFIAHPTKKYYGLYIEIKRSKSEVFLKDGVTCVGGKKGEHIQEQSEMITRLNKLGYLAGFGFGFDHCKKIIDAYMV